MTDLGDHLFNMMGTINRVNAAQVRGGSLFTDAELEAEEQARTKIFAALMPLDYTSRQRVMEKVMDTLDLDDE